MLRDHFLAFDDNVKSGSSTSYTSDEFAERLAKYDQMAIFIVVEQTLLISTVAVQVEHSGDGAHWTNKNATSEINASPGGDLAYLWGGDDGTAPSLPFVRLRISLTVSTPALVKVYVALRDIS
jgi:hypothetical protein